MPASTADRPRLVLAMLVIAYTLNFVDRQVIGILAGPIKADLGLTDTQLGLMGGAAFAVFYAVMGIPLARLADRTSRAGVVSAAIATWSGFTALCGLAPGFVTLLLCRMGVGVGEAGGVAPSYALIADRYAPAARARALAIFAFGSPIGSALGFMLGGYIATNFDWRVSFIVLGVAGLVFAPFFHAVVRDAPRTVPTGAPPPVWPHLAKNRAFWLLSFGAAATSVAGYGILFWGPQFLTRVHGFDLLTASRAMGALVLIGGVTGSWLGGWTSDRLATRSRAAYALVPALATACSVPLYSIALMTDSMLVLAILALIPNALALTWIGPVMAAIQGIVPSGSRATASAVFLLVLNFFGLGGGALIIGALSDAMNARFGAEALRYAILAVLSFYVIGAALFAAASRGIDREWRG